MRVIIVGGGMAGATLALATGRGAGVHECVAALGGNEGERRDREGGLWRR